MPKILRIINRFNIGGPTYNASILTRYLNGTYETKLIGGAHQISEKSSQYILDKLGVECEIVSSIKREFKPMNDRHAYKKIVQIIKDYQPDIIHTHASKAGALGRAAGMRYKKAKMVHTFHGHVFHSYFGKFKTLAYRTIERNLAKKTDKIIAISALQKKELVEKYNICNEDKVEIIPLGFDLSKFSEDVSQKRDFFRNRYHLEKNEIAIGIVGRLTAIKNHKLFLNAFKQLQNKTNQKVRAFIIGDGEDKTELLQYSKKLGINTYSQETSEELPPKKQVDLFFTSWIKSMDIAYAGLDIVALTSKNEGTPVSLIEAQAASKPIVSTEVGGIADTVIKNQTALLSPSDDVDTFTENLLKLVNDNAMRRKLSENSKHFAETHFNHNRLVSDINKLYDSILF